MLERIDDGSEMVRWKTFKVKIIFTNNREKIETVSAEDELAAIDLVMKGLDSKRVLDIKVI